MSLLPDSGNRDPPFLFSFNTSEVMSADSISELPIHYGEVQKDGTRVERPGEERPGRRSTQDEPARLVKGPGQSATIHHATLDVPEQEPPMRTSRDESRADRGTNYGRGNSRRLSPSFDAERPNFGRDDYKQNVRDRRRYDDCDRYSDYEDEYDEPNRPRRIRDRSYFPEDDDVQRRRPSRSFRPGNSYPRDPRRSLLDDYDNEPPTRRSHSQKKPLRPPRVQEEEDEEAGGDETTMYPRESSIGINGTRQLHFKDLTREEQKEIMRLPWTQWMNSSTKNREQATALVVPCSL